MNKKEKSGRLIIAGILLGLLQIFHILHFISLFSEISIIEQFYDFISDDNFILLFFNDSDKDEKDKFFYEKLTTVNISKIISKKARKAFFKKFFGILSGLSYANSCFTVIINFLSGKDKSPNYKLGLKALLYSIFNPGSGFLISSVVLIDSCKCNNEEKCDKCGFFTSLIGILFSIFLMICPIFICLGIYLLKIAEPYTSMFPFKFTILFIGILGTFISFSFSLIKKNSIIASYEKEIKPFDIVYNCGEKSIELKSGFGISSFIRILLNLILSGMGTLSLMCRYDCYKCCCSKERLGPLIGFCVIGIFSFIYVYKTINFFHRLKTR